MITRPRVGSAQPGASGRPHTHTHPPTPHAPYYVPRITALTTLCATPLGAGHGARSEALRGRLALTAGRAGRLRPEPRLRAPSDHGAGDIGALRRAPVIVGAGSGALGSGFRGLRIDAYGSSGCGAHRVQPAVPPEESWMVLPTLRGRASSSRRLWWTRRRASSCWTGCGR